VPNPNGRSVVGSGSCGIYRTRAGYIFGGVHADLADPGRGRSALVAETPGRTVPLAARVWIPRNRTNSSRGSGVQRLPERTPPLTQVLDDLARLLVANLDEFVGEVTAFPFDDHRGELPAEVLPQSLIRRTVIMLKPSHQPVRVVDRAVFADYRVVSDLVWHLRTLPS
jgi:hypothetical protein